jgi:glyoxylase I family protein
MPNVTQPRLHHLAVTVTDLDASVSWYGSVFDVHPVLDVPHPGGVGRILAGEDRQLMIALHRHDSNDGKHFTETATGLDHAGFAVPTRHDLELWQAHLESNGVVRAEKADQPLTQSPIADEPYASVLVFRDPDNIQLELFAPAQTRGSGSNP